MKEQSATPKFGASRRSKYSHGASATEVPTITNAIPAHSDEMRQRMVKYAVTMGIRMVCIGAIFLFDGWYRLIPVIGAVLLPWVAVVIANGAADVNHQETVDLLDAAPLNEVAGGSAPMDDAESQQGDILTGEIVPDEDDTAGDTAPDQPGQEHHEHL
ncbi:DUF3099 domain-containing protein [Arthrobacter alpinus]|uniref:DUF3099 domain-containing protein n=1 Tax=Arthrobacter alpinus TaxID=656366 RepID=UPI0005CA5BFE|nr:DUF3099 domain-containing protein [Arthrobacter alpinus]